MHRVGILWVRKESYDLCDISRVRNTKSRQNLQKLVTTTEIMTPTSTDHSPVLFSLSKEKDCLRGKGFWKFNISLTKTKNYITEIKELICSFCTTNESLFNRQLKWEHLKYEVRKFTINYTKQIAKEKRQQRTNLENQLKVLEKKSGWEW